MSHTLHVIAGHIAALDDEHRGDRTELRNFLGYIAENRRQMDGAEKASLRQMASVLDRKVQDAASRVQRLHQLAHSPYFGRLDFRRAQTHAVQPMYIGMSTLIDDDEMLVYDWRAPIAGMYYDAEVGPADYVAPAGRVRGDILLKRQYKIEQGELRFMFDSSLVINDEMLQEALAQNTSEKMRHIVTSIQQEQNRVIRNEQARILIVHGPAGSGKTSIALHRAAYLLYRYRESMSAEQMMIFSPNGIFADYISSVLPELGEENICQATFDAYAATLLGKKVRPETRYTQMEYLLLGPNDATFHLRTKSIRFKAGPLFHRVLTRYVEHLEDTLWQFADLRVGGTVLMSAAEVAELYQQRCAHLPLLRSLAHLKEMVLLTRPEVEGAARPQVRKQLDAMLQERDVLKLYRQLFADPVLLRDMADGDQALPAALEEICALTSTSLMSRAIWYEDVAPLLLLKLLLEGAGADGGMRHVIIDEAQDYTPIHFAVMQQSFPDSSMTILGDLDQAVNPWLHLRAYQDLAGVFGRDAGTLIRLTKSYRSSREIAALARAVLPNAGKTDDVRVQGELPWLIATPDDATMAREIAERVTHLQGEGYASLAVICKTAQQARALHHQLKNQADLHLIDSDARHFHHGSIILPIYLAKGLEFDAVILADVSAVRYGQDSDRRLLYTASTRALHRLYLYYTGTASPLLPPASAGLYRSQTAGNVPQEMIHD